MVGSDDFEGFGDSENEMETHSLPFSSHSSSRIPEKKTYASEASSSAGPSCSKVVSDFVAMGFSKEHVNKAIELNGEDDTDSILEHLLTYTVVEASPSECGHNRPEPSSSLSDDFLDDFSDVDNFDTFLAEEDNMDNLTGRELILKLLEDMGYPQNEASIALDRCGSDASIAELIDCISAAQIARAFDYDDHREKVPYPRINEEKGQGRVYSVPPGDKKRRLCEAQIRERKREKRYENKHEDEDDDAIHLPNPMTGFGLPGETWRGVPRTIPKAAMGPPYFYFENVALAPKGVWQAMTRFLFDIEPEFVDSQFFCAANRKRGYIHNLPINGRFRIEPIPEQTIHTAFPSTREWWPSWDHRTKLNCIQTCQGSAKLTERIRKALEGYDVTPPVKVQKYVMSECKRWNLVWVGKNSAVPLECSEIEMLLGFPRNHTRGVGSIQNRLKGLGNSFQVDTVAYHLSVLKKMFPNGLNVLSLFSGIGGTEVALHRLGIPLKNVVSVEICEESRNIVKRWWEQTGQQGNLIHVDDVQDVDADKLHHFISEFGGFDLVIGGSPCNNISGSNRYHRNGLEGSHSSLFHDYVRILNTVKLFMGRT